MTVSVMHRTMLQCFDIVNTGCCNICFSVHVVLVTGLPSSASWQDLKVSIILFGMKFMCLSLKIF